MIAKPALSAKRTRALLAQAQAGDERAVEILVEHNVRLVNMLAARFSRRSGKDFEECVSDGLFGLLKAIKKFNLDTPYAWTSYAVPCIVNTMKWTARPYEVSLDQPIKGSEDLKVADTVADDAAGPADVSEYSSLRRHLNGQLAHHLNTRENEVIRKVYGLDGTPMTQREIATEQGVSPQRIHNIHNRAMSKLQYRMEHYDHEDMLTAVNYS